MWYASESEAQETLELADRAPEVHFRTEDAVAVVGITEVIEALTVVERLRGGGHYDPAKVALLAAFAERVDRVIARPGSFPRKLNVDAAERSMLNLLLAQGRIRKQLPNRTRSVCKTCGKETLQNPDYAAIKERNSAIKGIAQDVVLGLLGRTASPLGQINSALGFLEPAFVCAYCKGLEGETSTVVFCPGCRSMHPEPLLTTCRACGHDFRADAGLDALWTPRTDECPRIIPRLLATLTPEGAPTGLAWLGDSLVVGTASGRVERWTSHPDAARPARLWQAGVQSAPWADATADTLVAMSPDGRTVAGARAVMGGLIQLLSADGTALRSWDLNAEHGPALRLAFNPDGRLLAAVFLSTVQLWDSATGALWRESTMDKGHHTTVAFSPDGTLLATDRVTMLTSRVVVHRVADGVEVDSAHGGDGPLAWTPDNHLVFARLSAVCFRRAGVEHVVNFPGRRVAAFALDAQGGRLAVALEQNHQTIVVLIDLDAGAESARIVSANPTTLLAFSTDGLLSVGGPGGVQLWDTQTVATETDEAPASDPAPEPQAPRADAAAGTPERLAVPAWHDPKCRKVVFDASTIDVGVLTLDARKLVYTTDAGVRFVAPLAGIQVTWPAWAKLTGGCDLVVDGTPHRLYFAKPLEAAPDLPGTASHVVSGDDLLGTVLALPGAIKEQRQGVRNADAVRAWLAHHAAATPQASG